MSDATAEPIGQATTVKVSAVERRVIPLSATIHAFLEPFVELTVSAQVAGEITEQWVEVADEVSVDQPLFKIDDETRKFERERSAAGRVRALNEFETAKANWERVRRLPEASATSLEHIAAHRRFLSAEANVNEASAAAAHAELMLVRAAVQSPINGVVSQVYQRKGEFVVVGVPLVDVMELTRLKLVAEVADHEVVWIRPDDPATFVTDALPGAEFFGTVLRVYPKALASIRRFQVEIEVPNADRRLRPGFFARGRITRGRTDVAGAPDAETLVVPRQALFERFGRYHVFRVDSDPAGSSRPGTARLIPVEALPVRADPRVMEVASGLTVGDRVATKGVDHLTDGAAVHIVE